MKQVVLLSAFLFLCSLLVNAQNAEGCDGDRYVNKIFNQISKSTITYGANTDAQGEYQELKMDIYESLDDPLDQRPTIILAHGGSFIQGERDDLEELCRGFAQRGYVAASIDYRKYVLQFPFFPDSLEALDIVLKAAGDLKAAVRHLRKDAATTNLHRIDTDRIFIGGASAGAIIALHAAYLQETDSIPPYLTEIIENNGGFEGNSGDDANLEYSSEVSGVFSLSGALYNTSWIDENDPPLVSYHGTEDDLVPFLSGYLGARFGSFSIDLMTVNGSGSLHAKADELEIPNYIQAVQGGGHEDVYGSDYQLDLDEFSYESLLLFHDLLCSGVEVLPSSTKEIQNNAIQIMISPNPTSEQLTIDYFQTNEINNILIYNSLGQLIVQKRAGKNQTIIQVSDLNGVGIYHVKFADAAGRLLSQTEKFIVVHQK